MAIIRNKQKIRVGKEVDKLEFLCTAGGNFNDAAVVENSGDSKNLK